MTKIILVVEDDEQWFKRMKNDLKYMLEEADKQAEIVYAETQEEAWTLFKKYDPDVVIMDACVPGTTINTQKLVERIIEGGYANPIITASSSSIFNRQLLECGATHNGKDKGTACQVAVEVL